MSKINLTKSLATKAFLTPFRRFALSHSRRRNSFLYYKFLLFPGSEKKTLCGKENHKGTGFAPHQQKQRA